MDDPRMAIRDIERMVQSSMELEAVLRLARKRYLKTMHALQQGMSVELALVEGDSAETRRTMTRALEEFEKYRHTSRMSLIAAAANEGSSINGIAKSWGISRQLASRLVSQLRLAE